MAGTTQKAPDFVASGAVVVALNAIVDALDAICTKLNADAGVTDTDYANASYKLNA